MTTKNIISIVVIALLLVLVGFSFSSNKTDVELPLGLELLTEFDSTIEDGSYKVVTDDSVVGWVGEKKITNSKHEGFVPVKSGSFVVNEGVISEGALVLDMTNITLGEEDNGGQKLLGHLNSPDFFDTASFPEAQVSILSVNEDGDWVGDLTIKGITNPGVFSMAAIGASEDEVNFVGSFAFDRTNYDITYGSDSIFDDLGDAVISDIVTGTFIITGTMTDDSVE